jgi:hypothetical protein
MDTHCLLIHPIDVGHQNHAIWMTLMIAAIVEEACCCCCCFVVVWLPSSSFFGGISERHMGTYIKHGRIGACHVFRASPLLALNTLVMVSCSVGYSILA